MESPLEFKKKNGENRLKMTFGKAALKKRNKYSKAEGNRRQLNLSSRDHIHRLLGWSKMRQLLERMFLYPSSPNEVPATARNSVQPNHMLTIK